MKAIICTVQMVGKVNRAKQHLIMEKHIDSPTEQQIADSMGQNVEKVRLYLQAGKLPASLEGPAETGASSKGDTEDVYLSDTLQDLSPSAEAVIMRVCIDYLCVNIKRLLPCLR